MNTINMDWAKHAKKKSKSKVDRRLSIPISTDLQKVIDFFKARNPDLEFSDSAVLMTFLEAGIKSFALNISATPAPAEAPEDEE